MFRRACLSDCETYRYWLSRDLGQRGGLCTFVMLNPSTADASTDDPTIRRCIGFAKSRGYGILGVVNLFALRATNPDELRSHIDPIGAENDTFIRMACDHSRRIVCAWGTKGGLLGRDKDVLEILPKDICYALGFTKDNHPKHPLYLPADDEWEWWNISQRYAGGA